MDHTTQPHPHAQMQSDNQDIVHHPYAFYPTDAQNGHNYGMSYPAQVPAYQVVHGANPHIDMNQYPRMGMLHQPYPGPIYPPNQTAHAGLPLSASPPPDSPTIYDPLSPPLSSGSDTSGEGIYGHHSRSNSATGSPVSSRSHSLVHRNSLRYHPTPSPSGSSGRRSRDRSLSDDDDLMGAAEAISSTRKEATRRQRIEAEQRRRDELRDGYAKLKDVLPVSNQKSSKVSLLERATNHIVYLENENKSLSDRLAQLEQEIRRLQSVNEKISLGVDTPSPGHPINSRPLSPPPDGPLSNHSLSAVSGQDVPHEESSGSEPGH